MLVRRHRQTFARTLRRAVLESRRPGENRRTGFGQPRFVDPLVAGQNRPDAATSLRLRKALAEDSVELDISGLDRARKNVPNGLRRWLEELGLWGRAAKDKFVPDAVFRAPREELALFLNRLFATDGWATVLASGQAQLATLRSARSSPGRCSIYS